jgi:hypothetical protein
LTKLSRKTSKSATTKMKGYQRKSINSNTKPQGQEQFFSDEDEYDVAYERELDLLRRRHNARRRPAIIKRVIKSNPKLLQNVGELIDKTDETAGAREVDVKDDKPPIREESGDCWPLPSSAAKKV